MALSAARGWRRESGKETGARFGISPMRVVARDSHRHQHPGVRASFGFVVVRSGQGVRPLAGGGRCALLIPWPCVHEFLAIVTHPRIFRPPTSVEAAVQQVDYWLESPSLVLAGESDGHWNTVRTAVLESKIVGPMVHDARVVAICLDHRAINHSGCAIYDRFQRIGLRSHVRQLLADRFGSRWARVCYERVSGRRSLAAGCQRCCMGSTDLLVLASCRSRPFPTGERGSFGRLPGPCMAERTS